MADRTRAARGGAKKLAAYAKKRDFTATPEPPARQAPGEGRSFVVQKHAARSLHYDFRLELDGVLKSWAVPKGPSLSPGDKRLAVEVEDHPLDYRDFEGTIPAGQYGGGEVIVWDRGRWAPEGDPHDGLAKGHLRFTLEGDKLAGAWSLIRIRPRGREKRTSWLLVKGRDEHASEDVDVLSEGESVISGRTIEDLAEPGIPAPPPSRVRGAKRAQRALPALEPQLATLVDEVPEGPGWVFEIKLDGYRALGVVEGGAARLTSRNGLDWTARFGPIAAALGHLRVKDAVLDGEVCAMDAQGRTSFQRLQKALSEDPGRLVYVVFDLLYRDGEDLRAFPLVERKEQLATLLAGVGAPLALSSHRAMDGAALLARACRHGLEGIVAKRADAPYTPGRTRSWLKIKCDQRQELVIVGYTPTKGKRTGLGALLVAARDPRRGGGLHFVCKVGTGFTASSRADLRRRLESLARSKPPVDGAPRLREATWVEPRIVCEVRFSQWTDDGALRHPAFLGLREDKSPADVVRERAAKAPPRERSAKGHAGASKRRPSARSAKAGAPSGVTITHDDRVLDEVSGVTKGDLARYYDAVSGVLLPHLKGRPLSLLRCPTGRGQKCFFQRHPMVGMGSSVRTARVHDQEILFVDGSAGVLELVQLGVIELHPWGSRLPAVDTPDRLVLDLDPDEGLAYGHVVEAALAARDLLEKIGLASWVKTTGGKGLHVVVPFEPRHRWAVVKELSRALAEDLARRAPSSFTATAAKAARRGKVYVDYLRNGEGATSVVAYGARARPGMTVSMPLAWKDLRRVHPRDFTVRTVLALLARRRRDPWADLLTCRQSLAEDLDQLLEKAR